MSTVVEPRLTKGLDNPHELDDREEASRAAVRTHHKAGLVSGLLSDQFDQLVELDAGDNFVADMVALYLDDTLRKVASLEAGLAQPGGAHLAGLEALVHSLKGGSASIGARRVAQACLDYRAAVLAGADEAALRDELRNLLTAYAAARAWLAEMLRLLRAQHAAAAAAEAKRSS